MPSHSNPEKVVNKSPARSSNTSKGDVVSQGLGNESLDNLSMLANQSKDSMALQDLSNLTEQSSSAKQLKAFSSQTPPAGKPTTKESSLKNPVQLEGGGETEKTQTGEGEGGGKKFAASVEQEMLLLQGDLSVTSKIKGFFGFESSFSKLQGLVNRYSAEKDAKGKASLKPQIITVGREWLGKHKGSKDKNDLVKKGSIERIIKGLESEKTEKPAELARLSDKVTTGTKIMSNLKGASNFLFNTKLDDKSSFQKIEPVFEAYQTASEGEITSIPGLINMLRLAQNAKKGINDWMDKHKDSTDSGDIEKRKTLEPMLDNIGKFKASLNI
jgi:hypothetical protein